MAHVDGRIEEKYFMSVDSLTRVNYSGWSWFCKSTNVDTHRCQGVWAMNKFKKCFCPCHVTLPEGLI